jgi:hypothetical protein
MLLFLLFGPIGLLFALATHSRRKQTQTLIRHERKLLKYNNPTAYAKMIADEQARSRLCRRIFAIIVLALIIGFTIAAFQP